jgi:hypothetical protein
MFLEKMRESAEALLAALETNEHQLIQEAQQNFSQAVEAAWRAYERGKIQTKGSRQALPRSMYLYATRELPQEVVHLRRWSTVKREITTFLRMMELVVVPSEED